MPPLADIWIRRATLDEIVALRHDVLRAGLPREAAVFDGDLAASTWHCGAFDRSGVTGCVTLHLTSWEGEDAWQLRGMAVRGDARNQGLGRELLSFVDLEMDRAGDARRLWCNARVPARRFYESLGWQTLSEIFEIPTAGPHVRMTKARRGEAARERKMSGR